MHGLVTFDLHNIYESLDNILTYFYTDDYTFKIYV